MAQLILKPIRHVYIALHSETTCAPTRFSSSTSDHDPVLREPSSYPLCNVPGHIHVDSASTAYPPNTMRSGGALVPSSVSSLAEPDAPSSSVPTPGPVIESHMTMSLPDTSHLAIQLPNILITPPDPAASGIAMPVPHPTPEISIPPSSPSPPAAVSVQHHADPLTHDRTDLPKSASSNPVLVNVLHTGQ
jgi:hypothetical protein